jgi:Spy/CpxP family protein refolding chaperone
MKSLAKVGLLSFFLSSALMGANAGGKDLTPEKQQALVEKHVATLTKKLRLTSDQQTQVRSIIQDKMDKKRQAADEADAKIQALLTPEQVEKYQKMRD